MGPDKAGFVATPCALPANLTEEAVRAPLPARSRGGPGLGARRAPADRAKADGGPWGLAAPSCARAVAALRGRRPGGPPRQGSGAFVAADASRVPFRIDPDGLSSIADVLEVMELRLAIEVEAAAPGGGAQSRPSGSPPSARALRAIEAAIEARRGCRQRGTSPSIAPFGRRLGQSALCRAARVPRAPRHSAPEHSRVREHAAGAAPLPGAHPEGARPHPRGPSAMGNRRKARKAMRTQSDTQACQRYRRLAERQLQTGLTGSAINARGQLTSWEGKACNACC